MRIPCLAVASVLLTYALTVGCGGSDEGADVPQPADAAPDATPARDAESPAPDATPVPDASPESDAALPVASPGTCIFTVDGAPYESAAGDVFTTAIVDDGGLTVQCVAIAGAQRLTVNLTASGVSATGTYPNSLAQLSEQPAEGGSATQYRTFTATLSVQELSANSVAGSCSFTAAGTAASKNVTVSFNLPRS